MNNKAIQILRTSLPNTNNNVKDEVLLDGQPFYNKTSNKIYIGDGTKKISQLKYVGQEAWDNFNLKSGEGSGSIEQKTYENDAKNPQATGLGAIAFGGFRGDKPNNQPDAEDRISIAAGIQSATFGAGTQAHGNWDICAGKDSDTYQRTSFTFGGKCKAGDSDTSKKEEYSFAFAANENNEAIARSSAAFGRYNTAHNIGEFVCGNYADNNRNPQTVFAVGTGIDDSRRSTGFEVRTDGHCYIHGKSIATEEYVGNRAVTKQGNDQVVYINEASGKSTVMPYRFSEKSIEQAEFPLMFQPMVDGRLYTRKPDKDLHAANKKYVDDEWNKFNLTNGEGQGSLLQKTVSSSGTPYNNEANGSGAVGLGKKVKSNGNATFVIGQENEAIAGTSASFTSGSLNVNRGSYNIVGGENNANNNSWNLVIGKNNAVSDGRFGIVSGLDNVYTGRGSTYNTTVSMLGNNLYAQAGGLPSDGALLIGQYNRVQNNPGRLFIVGNGTSPDDRKNAFEVLFDGRAKIQKTPQDTDDVANKGYVDDSIKINTLDTAYTGNIICTGVGDQANKFYRTGIEYLTTANTLILHDTSPSGGAPRLRIGDDAYFTDIDQSGTIKLCKYNASNSNPYTEDVATLIANIEGGARDYITDSGTNSGIAAEFTAVYRRLDSLGFKKATITGVNTSVISNIECYQLGTVVALQFNMVPANKYTGVVATISGVTAPYEGMFLGRVGKMGATTTYYNDYYWTTSNTITTIGSSTSDGKNTIPPPYRCVAVVNHYSSNKSIFNTQLT